MRPALAASLVVLVLAGCSTAAPAEPPTVEAPAPAPSINPSVLADLLAESNIPPPPSSRNAAMFLVALEAINPELLEDRHSEALINRGRDQCATIKDWPGDEGKWVWWAEQRFTSPAHPQGLGPATAKRVIAAARKYICPSY